MVAHGKIARPWPGRRESPYDSQLRSWHHRQILLRSNPNLTDKMTIPISPITQDLQTRLILLLDGIVREWDIELLEPLGAETRLVEDLGFESVDLMQLIVAIEQTFGVRGLPYEQVLMQDGGYVTEITVRQLTDFLHRFVPPQRPAGTATLAVGTRP